MGMRERVRRPACLVIEEEDGKKTRVEDFEPELPLSPGTKIFHQPNTNLNIIAVMGSGKKIDVNVLKSGIEATLIHHPRFSSLQVMDTEGRGAREGNGKWVRTRVELEKHIIVPDISNITITSPDRFLEDYISDLSATTLDFTKPLWEFHVINLPTTEAESVVILLCHHSIGDGVSLMSLLLSCFRKTSDPNSLPTIPNKTNLFADRRRVGLCSSTGTVGDVLGLLVRFAMLVGMLWNTFMDVFSFTATSSSWLKDTVTPISVKKGMPFTKKRFVHKTLFMEDIKCIKYAMNVVGNFRYIFFSFSDLHS